MEEKTISRILFWSFLAMLLLANSWVIVFALSDHKEPKIKERKEHLYRSNKGIESPYFENKQM